MTAAEITFQQHMHSSSGTPTASTMGAWHASVQPYRRAALPRSPTRAARDAHDHQGVNLRVHMAALKTRGTGMPMPRPRHADAGRHGALQCSQNLTLTLDGSRAAHLVADANLKPLFTPGLSRCSTGAPHRPQSVGALRYSTACLSRWWSSCLPHVRSVVTPYQALARPMHLLGGLRDVAQTQRAPNPRSPERKGAGPVAVGPGAHAGLQWGPLFLGRKGFLTHPSMHPGAHAPLASDNGLH